MELERLRFSGEAVIDLQIDAELNRHEIAPLLLLPLVENAFKHGLGKQAKNGWLKVNIGLNQSTLKVIVENTKPLSVVSEGKGGIGLDNLRRRLELLYPARHNLELEDKNNTFRAKLVIEL
jgi:LytS/YehU family sensor histidine kinase